MDLCDQRKAFVAEKGHSLVLGGPGSGKTTVALLRAKQVCETLLPGQSVLFLSFSRAAVRQIIDRAQALLTRSERRLIDVRTYHRFCLDVLEAHGRLLNGKRPRFVSPGEEKMEQLAHEGEWAEERRRRAVKEGAYCFDEFASGTADLFERSRAVVRLFSRRHPTVLVDEFQDTDDDQWRLVRALSAESTIVCLADPDQRIFEYRDNVDPKRVDVVREALSPVVFDFGGENHRSPEGGVLQFADAVLKGEPLPKVDEVSVLSFWERSFGGMLTVAVIKMFRDLRKDGVEDPCVAVLARSNPLVEDASNALQREQTLGGRTFPPIPHDVEWDADLTAAGARVVGSLLEWSALDPRVGVEKTLSAIAFYYQLKNAVSTRPTKRAETDAAKFEKAAKAVADGKTPAIRAGKELLSCAEAGLALVGDPVSDWMQVRDLVDETHSLGEIGRSVRLVRLFRATDDLADGLAGLWRRDAAYRGATSLIRRVLERERLLGRERTPRGCILMSFHKSKGKEFDGVVIVERLHRGKLLNEKEAPDYRACRRVLRVAITRARKRVALIRPRGATPL